MSRGKNNFLPWSLACFNGVRDAHSGNGAQRNDRGSEARCLRCADKDAADIARRCHRQANAAARVVMVTTRGLLTSGIIAVMMFLFDWRMGLITLAGPALLFVHRHWRGQGERHFECSAYGH